MNDPAIDHAPTLDCALCGATFDGIHDPYNGEPVTEGRVCTNCNTHVVIPARIDAARQPQSESED